MCFLFISVCVCVCVCVCVLHQQHAHPSTLAPNSCCVASPELIIPPSVKSFLNSKWLIETRHNTSLAKQLLGFKYLNHGSFYFINASDFSFLSDNQGKEHYFFPCYVSSSSLVTYRPAPPSPLPPPPPPLPLHSCWCGGVEDHRGRQEVEGEV